MDRLEQKPKSPYRWLLAIPLQLVINVLMVPLGFWADTLFWEKAAQSMMEEQGYVEGHGIPIFSVIIPLIGVAMTLFVIMASIFCTVVLLDRAKKNQQTAMQVHRSKSPYRWLLAIPIQLLNNVLLVPLGSLVDFLLWRAEDSASLGGYSWQEVSVFAILLPLAGVVVTVLVTIAAIVCTVVSMIRAGIKR